MNDYLVSYEIKTEVNKDAFKKKYLNNYLKDSLFFNLFMAFIVIMVGVLLIRSKEIVWYKFIIWFIIYVIVIFTIDYLTYIFEFKSLVKDSEKNKQICSIYKDRLELRRCDSSNVRIFKYEDAHEISFIEDREKFRFLFSDGKINVLKSDVSPEVFEYLSKLCK